VLFIFDFDQTICQCDSTAYLFSKVLKDKKRLEEYFTLNKKITNGDIDFHKGCLMSRRFIKFKLNDFNKAGKELIKKINPDIKKSMELIRQKGHKVLILSAGFNYLIIPSAQALKIHANDVHSCKMNIKNPNNMTVRTTPLTYIDGKVKVLKKIYDKYKQEIVFIGDGIIDLQTQNMKEVKKYIGFGLNVINDNVKKQAKVFVTTPEEYMNEIIKSLK
jgi:HAD superfamily phosphoserine phosphatase-like hydrolase